MLPNLGRLDLRDRRDREAVTSADSLPDLRANEQLKPDGAVMTPPQPPPPPAPTPVPPVYVVDASLLEEDDPDDDAAYKKILFIRNSDEALLATQRNGKALIKVKRNLAYVDAAYPLNQTMGLRQRDYGAVLRNAIIFDEPPNRYLFSSYGKGDDIWFMRAGPGFEYTFYDEILAEDVRVNVFNALRALRFQFGNRSKHHKHNECGSYNCFEPGVVVHGPDLWQLALRTVLTAAAPPSGGTASGLPDGMVCELPDTVAIRVPMASGADRFSNEKSTQQRDELDLTLRAAAADIAPRVYATFPIKIISEPKGTLAARGYGYVYEDGWTNFGALLNSLPGLHPDPAELRRAEAHIGRKVIALLVNLSQKVGYLLLDVKTLNMVVRRVPDAMDDYDVRMVDFGATFVAKANLYEDTTSESCIFFVNGLLLLNFIMRRHSSSRHIFFDLARMVERIWDEMLFLDDDFCALLHQDGERLFPHEFDPETNLTRTPHPGFQETLRNTFYRMLHKYGPAELINEADWSWAYGTEFVTRYVKLMVQMYEQAHQADQVLQNSQPA